MTGVLPVGIVGAAGWSADRWIEGTEPHNLGSGPAPAPLGTPFAGSRIARADRLTRVAAMAVERAVAELHPVAGERVATVGGSVYASSRTNERYERRRLRTGRAPPRDFPYTAPNAWLGEVAAALRARGPCLCLVGGTDVGLVCIATAIRMIEQASCDRAVVVVAECLPEDHALVARSHRGWADGSAAVVLETGNHDRLATIRAGWEAPSPAGEAPRSSVEVMADVLSAIRGTERLRVHGSAGARAGATCWVEVMPSPRSSA